MASCQRIQNVEDRYGIKFNGKREKIGLMPLSSQWLSYHKGCDRILWNPKNLDSLKNTTNAFYGQKEIRLKSDTLMSEADVFVGPESFKKPEQYVLLYYIYFYKPDEMYVMDSAGWKYQVIKGIGEDDCSANYITKNEADSILHSWRLKY